MGCLVYGFVLFRGWWADNTRRPDARRYAQYADVPPLLRV